MHGKKCNACGANAEIQLGALLKKPGMRMALRNVYLDFAVDPFFRDARMEAYERLLLDVTPGRLALFVRRDEKETAWTWGAPILEQWQSGTDLPKIYLLDLCLRTLFSHETAPAGRRRTHT
jgi:glucose-6-phosphate 1-dehydrogenase